MTNKLTTCESCLKLLDIKEWRVCKPCLRQEIINENQKHLSYCQRFLNRLQVAYPDDTQLIKDVKQEIKDTFEYINELSVIGV